MAREEVDQAAGPQRLRAVGHLVEDDDEQLRPQHVDEVIVRLPTALLEVEDNVRTDLGDLEALVQSIREHGLLVALVVRPKPETGRYVVVFGHRRLAAALLAQVTTVPCVIREQYRGAEQRTMAMAVEGLLRQPLSAIDEARIYQRLAQMNLTQRRIAGLCGCSQTHVSIHLALLRLPAELMAAVEAGQLSREAGLELSRLLSRTSRLDGQEHRLQALLLDIRSGTPPAAALEAQIRQLEADERGERNRAALRQQGVTILEPSTDEERADQWYAAQGPRRLGTRYREINVGLVEHSALPCHAAAISQRTGEIAFLCTDPAAHGRVDDDPDNLRRALVQSRRRREAEYQQRFREQPTVPASDSRIAAVLVDVASESNCKRAARWLGLEEGAGKVALQAWAAADPANLARAAVAVCVATDEALARNDHPAAVRRVLADASQRDGGLDPAEKAWLDRTDAAA